MHKRAAQIAPAYDVIGIDVSTVALYTVWNHVKQHKRLKGLFSAMASGLSETLWSMTDLAEMIDGSLPKPGKRGPYKKPKE